MVFGQQLGGMSLEEALRALTGSGASPMDPYREPFDNFVPGGFDGSGLPDPRFGIGDAIRFRLPNFGGTLPGFTPSSGAAQDLAGQAPDFIRGMGGGTPFDQYRSQFDEFAGAPRQPNPEMDRLRSQGQGFIDSMRNPRSPQRIFDRYRPVYDEFVARQGQNQPSTPSPPSGPGVSSPPTITPQPPPTTTTPSGPSPSRRRPALDARPGRRGT